jgi:hypothetical protein
LDELPAPGTPEALDLLQRMTGIPDDLDRAVLSDLAAIALTHILWRNTEVEDAHAAGRLSDAQMMIANIRTFRLVRAHIAADHVSWLQLDRDLFDGSREPVPGRPLRELLRGWMTAWRRGSRARLWGQCEFAEDVGHVRWLRAMAASVVGWPRYGARWFGCPWWPEIVDEFAAGLDGRADVPMPVEQLIERLRNDPETLPEPILSWCIREGLGFITAPATRWCAAHLHPTIG